MTTKSDINATTNEGDSIIPINRETVHRICSGQVVLSLSIAVKELVENAIDASSTIIDVRLKEYGSEFIEVSDNGLGVKSENFQNLTLKHYTSKIRDFTDLESIGTLGFRGEALSSLCALSDVTVTTRHRLASYASKITYDHNGKITSCSPAARDVGTTVVLQNLFKPLPVRRKEFLKNLKREFNKMCQLVYAYCLISKNIKITCTNQMNKGSRNTIVATLGCNTIRENIISVFGPKQMLSLIEVDITELDEAILKEFDLRMVVLGEPLPFKFDFLISNVMHGNGRSTTDRQFFYINGRPCEPHKVMKLINEVYRQFNTNQYPFVFLNVETERSCVDVNVTPDKRQVFLEKEKLLLAVIKSSLLEAFKTFPSTFPMQNIKIDTKITDYTTTVLKGIKRPLQESTNGSKEGSFLSKFKKSTDDSITNISLENVGEERNECRMEENLDSVKNENDLDVGKNLGACLDTTNKFIGQEDVRTIKNNTESLPDVVIENKDTIRQLPEETMFDMHMLPSECFKNTKRSTTIDTEELSDENKVWRPLTSTNSQTNTTKNKEKTIRIINTTKATADAPKSNMNKIKSQMVAVRTSEGQISEALKTSSFFNKTKKEDITVRFRSKISPDANKTAEQELQKQISKDMFQKMDIIGQFNLGFIIAKLDNDLFIIDQHATDEKYNFEQLQRITVLESQVLVSPKPLELSAGSESILIDNEEIFKRNGFNFLIKKDAPATKKVCLTAIPMSKNYTFGKDDIDEMLFMLQEDVNPEICRPTRVRSMFASRACRKSVMIGCPLSHSDMRRLVDHMGEIEHPWNCPHGRPTMRHLINLDLIQKD